MTNKFYKCFRLLQVLAFITILCIQGFNAKAQPIITLTPVITSGLSAPIQFVNASDGTNRVFIVQKEGSIRVYNAAFQFLDTFLTVGGISIDGEQGLLSLAFHPNYETNGFFFVYYVNGSGNLEIARYHVSSNPNQADAASKQVVITIPHPTNDNHNGGELHFGRDGFLYLSTGDGGGGGDIPNNAQNTSVLLGKILRLNVNTSATAPFYTVPAGNPFGNEIYSLGLRNPFRWSFDRLNGDMWIGDVGQGSWEEIDHRSADSTNGANYGWRCYEGDATYNTVGCAAQSNYTFPVYVYPNPGGAAVTGGLVYRGALYPDMYGYYLATDFYTNNFYIINPTGNGGWTTNVQAIEPSVSGISDFGETESGEAYAVSLTTGAVYRINGVDGGPVPVTLIGFNGNIVNHQVELHWKTSLEQSLALFDVEFSVDGNSFTYAGSVQAQNAATGAEYAFTHVTGVTGTVFYRLKMKDKNGRYSYSGIIRIDINRKGMLLVSPSVISNGIIGINLPDEAIYSSIELISTAGNILIKRDVQGQTGRINIASPELPPGIYIVRAIYKNLDVITQKIVIE